MNITASIGTSVIKFWITVETGRVIRGKARDCTKAPFPVIDLAPLFIEVAKNSKRKTPITTYIGKFGGRLAPCRMPKMAPYISAFSVGLMKIHSIPSLLRWFEASILPLAMAMAKSRRAHASVRYRKSEGLAPTRWRRFSLAYSARLMPGIFPYLRVNGSVAIPKGPAVHLPSLVDSTPNRGFVLPEEHPQFQAVLPCCVLDVDGFPHNSFEG